MDIDDIKQLLAEKFTDAQLIEVTLDGSHVNVTVVSDAFAGLRAVGRQKLVYSALAQPITSGEIHAVHMKTYTPDEQ